MTASLALLLMAYTGVAGASEVPALFDDDPEHSWNRLHAALWIRQDAEGGEYGHDRLDPLLWESSKHFLKGRSHARALAALDEFLSAHADTLIQDPFRRAMLQRDLWAIFDFTVGRTDSLPERLSESIDRLAMRREEIERIEDPYIHCDEMPRDLFEPDGGETRIARSRTCREL